MEGAPVPSPSSWERRRAWARRSRGWRSTAAEREQERERETEWEQEAAAAARDVPEPQPPHLDDVFLPGVSSSKIETWLQDCGSSVEMMAEEPAMPGPCGSGTSFEDDLTLGAEALLLPRDHKAAGRAPRDKLCLGHSLTSSVLSGTTTKTSSSISEILEWRQADAEEVLYSLGFVQSEPEDVARIPARFFSAPSQAKGIDFQLFLKCQVQRMEMEDPCLMLASRFQQVQALAVTADAFFCLYSYVSKTPVQRISPARLAWACADIPAAATEPMSPSKPVSPSERLRRAVSRMCLYAAPRVGRLVQEVLARARGQRCRSSPPGTDALQGAAAEMPLGTPQPRAQGSPAVPRVARSVPACPQGGGELVPPCCCEERTWTPRSSPPGTPAPAPPPTSTKTGHVEWPCPRCQGSSDSPRSVAPAPRGPEDVPCPSGLQDNPTGPAVTRASGTLDCAATVTSWTWDTPKQPAGLGAEGDSGLSSLGTSPWTNVGSQQSPSKTPGLCAASSPCPDKPDPTGRAGRRPRGRSGTCHPGDRAWKEGDTSGLRVLGTPLPLSPCWSEICSRVDVDSFEMEEVLSASEDDDDAREEATCSLVPSRTIRRGFMLHASSGRSDSSGFVEELVAAVPPSVPLHGTASPTAPRPAADPPGTLRVPGGYGDPWDSGCPWSRLQQD